MVKEKFYELMQKIPKTEIHLHSEALVSKKTISEILSRKHPEYRDMKNVNNLFVYKNLSEFIKVFLLIQNSFEKVSDFELLFKNILPYLKRNGIVYSEIFFSPSIFTKNGIEFENILKIFIKEIESIKKSDNIEIKIIIDVSRTFGVDNAMQNLEAAINCKSKNIIGIGLGGDEKKGPAKLFEPVFSRAIKEGFHVVAHAGEDVGPESIWDSLNYLKVERIGHGISSIKDKKLMEQLKSKNIALEVCPTSNVFTRKYITKLEDHPIKTFFKAGILVTLNTDDPLFFNIELLDEYWNLYTKLNFSLDDIKEIIINGFKASFISEANKKSYISKVNSVWNKFVKN